MKCKGTKARLRSTTPLITALLVESFSGGLLKHFSKCPAADHGNMSAHNAVIRYRFPRTTENRKNLREP